jgi:hypothetical protein
MILFILDNARKNIRKFYVLCSKFYVKNSRNGEWWMVSRSAAGTIFKDTLSASLRCGDSSTNASSGTSLALSECRY